MTSNFNIIAYDSKYKQAFYDLNAHWIKEYFVMEDIDIKVLSDPQTHIIDQGGEVFFAIADDKVFGTIALKNSGNGSYELTKLGVDPNTHKGGAGTALCKKVIEAYQAKKDGKLLFLESNTVLTDARRLYDKLGFIEKPLPANTPYERANYYMELESPSPAL